jgi:transcriptional regulator GlxA family with amidase domain
MTDSRHRVGVLVYDGMTLLDMAGPVEVFTTANTFGAHYEVELLSTDGGVVVTSTGTKLMADQSVSSGAEYDTVLIPGTCAVPPDNAQLVAAVRTLRTARNRMAGICTGAFLLARAGILDERAATTHWRFTELLGRSFPAVRVQPDAIYVQDGSVLTSAGVTSGIDLALALVREDGGPELARDVARELVVFLQRPGGQSQFTTLSRLPAATSAAVRRVMSAVLAEPRLSHTAPGMARLAGMSTRHLTRLFQSEIGLAPTAFVEAARLETAKTLLLSGESVTAAAEAAGFGSDDSLRRAFGKHLGVSPTDYRARFTPASGRVSP